MVSESKTELSVSTGAPDAKFAPIIVGGAIFVGRAIVRGAISAAASWAATRLIENRFSARR